MESFPFRELLGALLYICTQTSRDIVRAIHMLGKVQFIPCRWHWKMFKHLPHYLAGTTDFGGVLKQSEGQAMMKA